MTDNETFDLSWAGLPDDRYDFMLLGSGSEGLSFTG